MNEGSRIDRRFAALKKEGRPAFVAFITAGDPDYATCEKILHGLPAAGADVIELGMPFSDPMADGPAVQASSLRALKSGQTMKKTLDLVPLLARARPGHADRAVRLLQPGLRLSRASASSTMRKQPASTASSSSTCRPRPTRSSACRPSPAASTSSASPRRPRTPSGCRQFSPIRRASFTTSRLPASPAPPHPTWRPFMPTSPASSRRPGCPSPWASA